MKRAAIAALFASAALLQGCASGVWDAPYSRFVMGTASADVLEKPGAIEKIDGQSTDNTRNPFPVAPGKHTLLVAFTTPRAVTSIEDQLKNLVVDAQPCKRYYIVARYANMTTPEWTPKVAYVENIGECAAKFGIK